MAEQLKNLAEGVLQTTIDNDDTAVVLQSGHGARFPASGNFRITIDQEIMLCTSRSTDTLTVTRAQEGTTGVTHTAGATVAHTLTKGGLDQYLLEKVPLPQVRIDITTPVASAYWDSALITWWTPGFWVLLNAATSYVDGHCIVPPNATGGNVRAVFAHNATTGVARYNMQAFAPADGEVLTTTGTATASQDITVPGTAYMRKDVVFPVPITIAPSDLLVCRFVREGSHGNDTLAVDSLLLGAWLEPS